MYKRLTDTLAGTKLDFATACHALGLDPSEQDPKLLKVVQCDNCSYWEGKKASYMFKDETVYCRVCYDLETLRF